jgi:23S rRNA (guanosine2251-2'-O)-methyltransferase
MRRARTVEERLAISGVNPVLELLRSGHPVERVVIGGGPRLREVLAAAEARGVKVVEARRDELERLARSPHHQGVVAETPPFPYGSLDRIAAASGTPLVLDGVQDPRNLGAILRTARAVGVAGVVLPRDRSVGVTAAVVAASAGLVFGLTVARVPNLVRAIEELKEAGAWMVGLAADGTESLFRLEPPSRAGLVIGGEGDGLRPLVRRTCDFVVSIPMAPGVESLNVSVAAGVALYALGRGLLG